MQIGILTGGGDVPGLNPSIKALVYRAIDEGHTVLGFRRGWEGLLYFNPDDPNPCEECTVPLDRLNTRTIDRTGGTILHTSRINPAKVYPEDVPDFLAGAGNHAGPTHDFTTHILRGLAALEIDAIVPIGGDDTLNFAARLHQEGFPVVGIPKTMDNDITGTEYCIGFSTAVTRSVQLIHQFRTSAGSHERLALVELFGRNSGETCLISSLLAGVDRSIISEVPFDPEHLGCLLVEDRNNNPSRYAMVALSEGARFVSDDPDQVAEMGSIGLRTAEVLKQITNTDTIFQQVAYLMRSGAPDSLDLMVAMNYANLAMDLINHRRFGRMTALQGGHYTDVPIEVVTQGVKEVDVEELYDAENYRPRLRSVRNKPMFLY